LVVQPVGGEGTRAAKLSGCSLIQQASFQGDITHQSKSHRGLIHWSEQIHQFSLCRFTFSSTADVLAVVAAKAAKGFPNHCWAKHLFSRTLLCWWACPTCCSHTGCILDLGQGRDGLEGASVVPVQALCFSPANPAIRPHPDLLRAGDCRDSGRETLRLCFQAHGCVCRAPWL